MESLRIQKYIAECGLMSRRAAEREIEEGSFTVNGKLAYIGQKIRPGYDQVSYKGKKVRKENGSHFVYIMLNKPKGYVTTLSDEKGRKCVAELVRSVKTRVYPVGRLDMASEGLLLLTNDGDLTNKLTHPKHEMPKIYKVKVKGKPTKHCLDCLNRPMIIDGYKTKPACCEVISQEEDKTVLQFTLLEGRNRQIRKMCEQVGLQVQSLKRIAIGELSLGNLPRGRFVYLKEEEIEYLKGERKHVEDTPD
ncbi:MAG: rRNA pseudouridine synthase [Clostridiales bacterium]|nr:rRNA pseudouridine synthase [Clostridiales bacterium]